MCIHCQLAAPQGAHEICHACAIALREEARGGLRALEEHLDSILRLERWLAGEGEDGPGAGPEPSSTSD
jgi:hypothetical protein